MRFSNPLKSREDPGRMERKGRGEGAWENSEANRRFGAKGGDGRAGEKNGVLPLARANCFRLDVLLALSRLNQHAHRPIVD
jgi:hypothetical protein